MSRYKPTRLSQAAFDELKTIVLEEYGDTMSDFEIEDMGVRLLHLFQILATEPEKHPDEELLKTGLLHI